MLLVLQQEHMPPHFDQISEKIEWMDPKLLSKKCHVLATFAHFAAFFIPFEPLGP